MLFDDICIEYIYIHTYQLQNIQIMVGGEGGYYILCVFVFIVHPPPSPPHKKINKYVLWIFPLFHVILLNNNKQWALKGKSIVFKQYIYIYIYSILLFWEGGEIWLVVLVHQLDGV